ncbi:phage tail protein [Mucilaginibacter pedocola]|uniref:Phage tail collar domain-containing protein n=1 Tax=Mucilaginibacter pedocola TaxID=1792845 RepID=A0A1S9PG70_9SPHI|nr:phage tail protein [Mucilaginibacter pedocola]OOQ59953.1 hypothetical protein BC343_27770 [Mucilaginibacter pedocola]
MKTEELKANEATATAMINNLPIGTVMPYMGVSETIAGLAAQGWLLCDGKSYSQTEKAALFNIIKKAHGGNDTHFNVPDLQGVFLRGVDRQHNPRDPDSGSRSAANHGGYTGNAVGSYQADAFKKHTHNTNEWNTSSFRITHHDDNWNPPNERKSVASSEAGDSTETRPRNISTYYIIFAGLPQ